MNSDLAPAIKNFRLPGPAPETPDRPLVTAKALINCAKLTKESAEFLCSPKYSLFLASCRMYREGGAIGEGLAVLGLMGSPFYGFLRLLIGGTGTIGGALSTVATAASVPVEWLGRKIIHKKEPSTASIQREALTQKFVERMHEILRQYPFEKQEQLLNHPQTVIQMVTLAIAFLSRGVEQNDSLLIGGNLLSIVDFQEQDQTRQNYFRALCDMKTAIRNLKLPPHESSAWKLLNDSFSDMDPFTDDQRDNIVTIMRLATTLSEYISNDSVFKKHWNGGRQV